MLRRSSLLVLASMTALLASAPGAAIDGAEVAAPAGAEQPGRAVPDAQWSLAVRSQPPGSDDVSVFRVDGTSLVLTARTSSHGDRPVSVTASGDLVYVLNVGGSGGIRGFRRSASGGLLS